MIGKTIHELSIGDTAEFSKTVSESDIYQFAGITGDFNPAHMNEAYAKKTFFKTRIADTITARVEVIEIMDKKKQVRLKTVCVNQEGTQVLDGEAIVSPPRPQKK